MIKKIKEINIKAKNTNRDIWVFFDELNTCDSFAILTEIFSNRSFERENLSNNIKINGNDNKIYNIQNNILNVTNNEIKNIKIIGACNPYRIREENSLFG